MLMGYVKMGKPFTMALFTICNCGIRILLCVRISYVNYSQMVAECVIVRVVSKMWCTVFINANVYYRYLLLMLSTT